MAALTTDDCKKKLVELYPRTQAKSWKRTKKSLNAQKQWERVFECTDPAQARTVVLVERAGMLFEVGTGAVTGGMLQTPVAAASSAMPVGLHALPSDLFVIVSDAEMTRTLFGSDGQETLSTPFVTSVSEETRFLMVLEHTLDWNAPEKARSSYDFAKNIDFKAFTARCTVQGIDLLGSYLDYMESQIYHLSDLDEGNYVDIAAEDYDDSLADLMDVLVRIRQGFEANKWHAPMDPASMASVAESLAMLQSQFSANYSPNDEDDSVTESLACLEAAVTLFSSGN